MTFRSAKGWLPEILSLPMFPQLTPQQQSRVAEESLRFLKAAILSR